MSRRQNELAPGRKVVETTKNSDALTCCVVVSHVEGNDHRSTVMETAVSEVSSNSLSSPSLPLQKPQQQILYRYSIDVLSNGTEYASCNAKDDGAAIPALFLSIWKVTAASILSDKDSDGDYEGSGLLLARYGLSGVGSCDGLARIAADQQFKLGPVRAVFFMDHSDGILRNSNHNPYSPSLSKPSVLSDIASLPSILYACQQATLSLILPNPIVLDRMEQLVQLVHGNHTYPKVLLCSVPETGKETKSMHQNQWWNVFEDDHVIVHATRWASIPHDNGNGDDVQCAARIMYLVTFQRLVQQQYSIGVSTTKTNTLCPDSILILPAHDIIDQLQATTWDLPIIEVHSTAIGNTVIDHQTSLLHTFMLAKANRNDEAKIVNTKENHYASHSILRYPPCGPDTAPYLCDPHLLVRGRQQTLSWRQHCDASLLEHFPFRSEHCSTSHSLNINAFDCLNETEVSSFTTCQSNTVMLRTGTSIIFDVRFDEISSSAGTSIRIIDRNILRELRQTKNGQYAVHDTASAKESRDSWPRKMKEFLRHPGTSTATRTRLHSDICVYDENEIDLDIDGITNDDSNHACHVPAETGVTTDNGTDTEPQLLILGTGCASPSPYRSASGYALIIPPKTSTSQGKPSKSSMIFAVEIGESFCTQFHRYGDGHSLGEIQLIWISHAHWDHYGGLVNLLLQIQQINGTSSSLIVERQPKRIKQNSDVPNSESIPNTSASTPYVVAPPKVLKYLRLVFDDPGLYYNEVHMHDTALMDKVLQNSNEQNHCLLRWVNVRVDHSCLSYGFALVLQLWECQKPYIFVFSGDTRPCRNLVDLCRALAMHYKANHRVDFLLHEATFDDNEFNMSVTKKHSTVAEAVMVGRDIDAERLLLTHFSQRYDSVPTVDIESARFDGRMNIGFALDGMKVFL
jgi:ribonuclease BN (tRNA processing enzyme)